MYDGEIRYKSLPVPTPIRINTLSFVGMNFVASNANIAL